jgi:hypothetical protein
MWALKNRTSYAAERNWTRGKRGEHHWIVAVKATFSLGDNGSLALADEQIAPTFAPEYRGEPGLSSLKYDSDLLAVKPGTDILINGSAHAAQGIAVSRVPVSLCVGDLRKALVVHGDRVYYEGATGLATTPPRPFTSRPITYESAYGGADMADPDPRRRRIDPRNPVGKGFASSAARLVELPAHNVEYLSGDAAALGPAGFGPIDRAWSPRLELAGTYDAAWAERKRPLLPEDYDDRHALSAPRDQRPEGYLRGGEEVELVNLTPGGVLRFALPRIALGFTTRFGSRAKEHAARLTTVFLEPDLGRLMLVWQSSLMVPAKDVEHLDDTVIVEKRYLS